MQKTLPISIPKGCWSLYIVVQCTQYSTACSSHLLTEQTFKCALISPKLPISTIRQLNIVCSAAAACESIWVAYCYNLDYEAAQRKLVKCGMFSYKTRRIAVGLLFLVMAYLEYPGIFQKYNCLPIL